MVKNLIGIFLGICFFIAAFIIKHSVIKIVAIVIAAIILLFAILWTIGTILEKKKNKKEQG